MKKLLIALASVASFTTVHADVTQLTFCNVTPKVILHVSGNPTKDVTILNDCKTLKLADVCRDNVNYLDCSLAIEDKPWPGEDIGEVLVAKDQVQVRQATRDYNIIHNGTYIYVTAGDGK